MHIFALPSTLPKEMNAVKEKLNFELVSTVEKVKECFMVKVVRGLCLNQMKDKIHCL